MAKVQDIMTTNPRSAQASTPLNEIARMMADEDCGLIPITDGDQTGRLLGVVTDRDIVVRVVAKGHDTNKATAQDCMSSNIKTCTFDDSIEKVTEIMESQQVRRVPVTDANGGLVGIVSLADLVTHSPENAAEAVKEVSEPAA